MIEIQGKFNTAKVFTDSIEPEAYTQLLNMMCQCWAKDMQVRIMPDVHAGKGCTVGTTMTIKDKVVPNLVGVDIGCLDKDTEFLTPYGWKKISEYNDDEVLLYDPNTGKAHFELPRAYIKNPCSKFYHFHNSKNLDQMVSDEHHLLVYKGSKARGFTRYDVTASDFVEQTKKMKKCDYYLAKSVFDIENMGLPYSDIQLRIFVMVSADGRIKPLKNGETYTELHFMKERKIRRAQELLTSANIEYSINTLKDGTTLIAFSDKVINTKDLTQFYRASKHQLAIVCDEVMLWDGSIDEKRSHRNYISTIKANADVIQYAFAASGVRASICKYDAPKENWNCWYVVTPTKNEYVSYKDVDVVDSVDGYKYCFNTSTGAFVIRRNDRISVTGNCGMLVAKLKDRSVDFDKLDKVIRERIPSGKSHRESKHSMAKDFPIEDMIVYKEGKMEYTELLSLGSLGGGNHFIELDKDSHGNLYVVIHSGSRHLGLATCDYWQGIAIDECNDLTQQRGAVIAKYKSEGREDELPAALASIPHFPPPKELSYLTGKSFDGYLHDMALAQEFATRNREAMLEEIVRALRLHVVDKFCTLHNYIDLKHMILRKGSVSAQEGERLIVPLNMRDGSLICTGKGNPDWNFSAPHGAGRKMSRSKAKESISLEAYQKAMRGIYTTCVNKSTLDESPMAYKPSKEIIENIKDSCDVVDTIKPVYNFKASD